MATSVLHVDDRNDTLTPSLAIKLGYSSGNFGKSIVWASFESFLLFYMVRLAGFDALTAGGLLACVMFCDAAADVTVAYLTDRHGRAGALGRLIQFGAPLCAVGYCSIFAARSSGIIVVGAVILCRIGYTLCDIGHNTLLIRVAPRPGDATGVSGFRLVFSAAGTGVVGLASAHVLSLADASEQRTAFAVCGIAGGVIYLSTLMTAMWVTRKLPSARPDAGRTSPKAMLFALARNPSYRKLLLLVALQAGLLPMFTRSLPFFGELIFGDASWGGSALTTITIAQATSLPAWIWLSRSRSAGQILTIAYLILAAAMATLAISPSSAENIPRLAIIGIAYAGMNIAIWAMLTSTVRDGMTDGGTVEALPVGLFLATLKASAGVGNLLFAVAVSSQNWRCIACMQGDRSPFLLTVLGLPLLGCAAALAVNVTRRGRRDTEPMSPGSANTRSP